MYLFVWKPYHWRHIASYQIFFSKSVKIPLLSRLNSFQNLWDIFQLRHINSDSKYASQVIALTFEFVVLWKRAHFSRVKWNKIKATFLLRGHKLKNSSKTYIFVSKFQRNCIFSVIFPSSVNFLSMLIASLYFKLIGKISPLKKSKSW